MYNRDLVGAASLVCSQGTVCRAQINRGRVLDFGTRFRHLNAQEERE